MGPTFTADADSFLLIESKRAFGRGRYHRQRAHLILSAIRHAVVSLPGSVEFHQVDRFHDVLDGRTDLEVIAPTSYSARRLVATHGIPMHPSRGFVTSETEFAEWVTNHKLRLEDFYRWSRRRHDVLMDGDQPVGERWNFDEDNRQSPPRGQRDLGLVSPWQPVEDEIDERVRRDLDDWERSGKVRFVGSDGPRRFAVTPMEAEAALDHFIDHRLAFFGPYEDAAMIDDWTMAHSLLSVPMNLGVLDPITAIRRVEQAFVEGRTPLSSVEGFIRQVMGWRDYVWHLYWHFGEDYVARSNALNATRPLPEWMLNLDADAVTARCLKESLGNVHDYGWAHHILRLMVLGNYQLQRGFDPQEVNRWFSESFVDGTPWVMPVNTIGMALYADGGAMSTKPYAAGGAYIKRMTNFCTECAYKPTERTGDRACPFTVGYWSFLHAHRETLAGNHRMSKPLGNLARLSNIDDVLETESRWSTDVP